MLALCQIALQHSFVLWHRVRTVEPDGTKLIVETTPRTTTELIKSDAKRLGGLMKVDTDIYKICIDYQKLQPMLPDLERAFAEIKRQAGAPLNSANVLRTLSGLSYEEVYRLLAIAEAFHIIPPRWQYTHTR